MHTYNRQEANASTTSAGISRTASMQDWLRTREGSERLRSRLIPVLPTHRALTASRMGRGLVERSSRTHGAWDRLLSAGPPTSHSGRSYRPRPQTPEPAQTVGILPPSMTNSLPRIEPTEAIQHGLDDVIRTGTRTSVRLNQLGTVTRRDVPGGGKHGSATPQQPVHRCLPDPLRSSRDQNSLSGELVRVLQGVKRAQGIGLLIVQGYSAMKS